MSAINLLGYSAGVVITSSTLPKVAERIIRTYRGRATFSRSDLHRDILQAFGNALWIAVGLMSGVQPMVFFCSLNCVLLITLVGLNLMSRTRSFPL